MADSAIPVTTRRNAALASLGLGLLIALAANLTYAVPRGPVVVGLGLVAPLVLPVVLYLRTTFSADGTWPRVLREVATLLVAGPAAAVSYVHTYQLVLGAGEPLVLALLAPLSSDGLAGMATLALHRMRQPVEVKVAPKSRPRRGDSRTPAVVAPTEQVEPETKQHRVAAGETAREWAVRNWPVTGAEVQLATKVKKASAYRIVRQLREGQAS